jgi:hypothetical protein
MTKKTDKLVVTNYDNFKNADFFKKQYLQAQEMIKEVNDFYKSFCMSKLLTSKDLVMLKPYLLINCPWSSHFIFPDYKYDMYINARLNGKKCDKWNLPSGDDENKSFAEILKDARDYTNICISDLANIFSKDPQYDCYYVLDQNNCVQEFIPVKCKDTISIDFSGDDIKISGYYYSYSETGAPHGNARSDINKVIRTIYINSSNNNVVDVKSNYEHQESGDANGKTYWDKHISYDMTDRTSKSVKTHHWNGLRRTIKNDYDHFRQLARNFIAVYTSEDYKMIMLEKYAKEFEQEFHRPITKEYIERCCSAWD